MFGGAGGHLQGDTWMWTGSCWQVANVANSPSPRFFAAAAFDPDSHEVVLYGGRAAAPEWFDDTWIWTGADWTHLQPAVHPTLAFPAGAYDPVIHKFVIFGLSANSAAQTWTWDGTVWQQVSTSSAPSARYTTALAYDPISKEVILFGGRTDAGLLGDTWTFDGSQWKQLTVASAPAARGNAFVATVAQGVLLYGGGVAPGANPWETWLWSGAGWQKIAVLHQPPIGPSAGMTSRSGAALLVSFTSWSASASVFLFSQGDWAAM